MADVHGGWLKRLLVVASVGIIRNCEGLKWQTTRLIGILGGAWMRPP